MTARCTRLYIFDPISGRRRLFIRLPETDSPEERPIDAIRLVVARKGGAAGDQDLARTTHPPCAAPCAVAAGHIFIFCWNSFYVCGGSRVKNWRFVLRTRGWREEGQTRQWHAIVFVAGTGFRLKRALGIRPASG